MTAAQHQVLIFIDAFQTQEGFPPTRRNICKYMGWTSPSTPQGVIGRLEAQGLVERVVGTRGVLRVTPAGRLTLTKDRLAA